LGCDIVVISLVLFHVQNLLLDKPVVLSCLGIAEHGT